LISIIAGTYAYYHWRDMCIASGRAWVEASVHGTGVITDLSSESTQRVCAAFAAQFHRSVTAGPNMQLGRFLQTVGLCSVIGTMGLAVGCGGERVSAPGAIGGKVLREDLRSQHKELKESKKKNMQYGPRKER
jgi:hypothetical protein